MHRPHLLTTLLLTALPTTGCFEENEPTRTADEFETRCPDQPCQVGFICARDNLCRQPGEPGAFQRGQACTANGDCALGLVCGAASLERTCEAASGPVKGEDCSAEDPCRPDFICTGDGLCADPGAPGTGDVGTECSSNLDCRADRACSPQGDCVLRDGPGEDEPCREGASPCRSDLVCSGDGVCQQPGGEGTGLEGADCATDADCVRPLVCSTDGACVEAGTGNDVGEPCGPPGLPDGPGPCLPTLVCASDATCQAPEQPGTAGDGAPCGQPEDCRLGLLCAYGTCSRPVIWEGADCSAEDPKDPPVAFFRVPRGDQPLPEFYRLPFPNDARVKGGRIDLSGHPDPGELLPGGAVGRYLDELEGRSGFSVQPTILFRFSSAIDTDSLYAGEGEPKRLQLVDIDPDSPGRGDVVTARWAYRSGRTRYVCRNWVGMSPALVNVLAPGRTYAALLSARIEPKNEEGYARDGDFEAVMANAVPADPDLARAHAAYAPLREWLALPETMSAADVLVATVFTTDDPAARTPRFRQAVRAADPPGTDDLTLCGGGAVSPCAAGGGAARSCPDASPEAFSELHGTYTAPVFQEGTRPYLDEGGAVRYDVDGVPVVADREQVCYAVTVPKQPMPDGGWPLVLYLHGTNGNFRTFVDNGWAEELAEIGLPEGEPGRWAVIGIDGPMHGPRRGESDEPPDQLFFNLRNPRAGRDNVLQGAADLFTLARFAEAFERTAEDSPTGEAIRFDPDRIWVVGHSQGGITGSLAIPFEPLVKGAVLSGTGGGFIASLLEKRNPVDVATAVKLAVGEEELDRLHAMLGLIQWTMDPADPAAHARHYFADAPEGRTPPHVFLTFGVGDTYTPPSAMGYLARSMGLHVARPVLDDSFCLRETDLPVSNSKWLEVLRIRVTAVTRQYQPNGHDGHFVMFQHTEARRQTLHFLGTAARDGVPILPE